jgi:hypothetical protein
MRDHYCFLCGNTSYPFLIDELLSDAINVSFDKNISDRIKWIDYNNEWMRYCTILTFNNEIFHNCKPSTDSSGFIPEKKIKNNISIETNKPVIKSALTRSIELYNDPFNLLKHSPYNGIFLHTDCWQYIKKKFKIELKYGDLPIWKPKYGFVPFNINYGDISKYWGQEFNFKKICIDGNHKLCESPLKSKKIASFVNKVFKQLKIRRARSSPSCSATLFNTRIYKFENNAIWHVINNKWSKIPLQINKIILQKDIHTTKYIGEVSDVPEFIYFSGKHYYLYSTNKTPVNSHSK